MAGPWATANPFGGKRPAPIRGQKMAINVIKIWKKKEGEGVRGEGRRGAGEALPDLRFG